MLKFDPLAAIISLLIMDWIFKPKTRREKYRRVYLKSNHWQQVRQKIGEGAGWKCEVKGCANYGKGLNAHHLNYERVGKEKMSDLVYICPYHHSKVHGGEAFRTKSGGLIPAYRR